MKKFILLFCLFVCFSASIYGQSPPSRFDTVASLKSTSQNFTASWVDYASEIDCRGYLRLGIWLTIDINDTQDARIRALAKHTSAGTEEYLVPIQTVSASDIKLAAEYYEFNSDADQLMILQVDCNNILPYIQLQISAGTAGASPGNVTKSYLTIGY